MKGVVERCTAGVCLGNWTVCEYTVRLLPQLVVQMKRDSRATTNIISLGINPRESGKEKRDNG